MLKAGSAGSNPDGVTKSKQKMSHAFSVFLNETGDAVANLNTLVVGLDAVEEGYEKPNGLDISWNPIDRKAAARKSRKFVLESILVRVSGSLDEFVEALSKLPRFDDVRSKWDGKTPSNEKIETILEKFLGESYLVSSSSLMIHWRNKIVHSGSRARLRHDRKKILHDNEDEIYKNYKNLSVDCLLCHFEENRPTLKDISSLIAMSINAARKIDNLMYSNLSKEELDVWLDHYGINKILKKVRLETKPEKLNASICRVFASQAPLLYESYRQHYEC